MLNTKLLWVVELERVIHDEDPYYPPELHSAMPVCGFEERPFAEQYAAVLNDVRVGGRKDGLDLHQRLARLRELHPTRFIERGDLNGIDWSRAYRVAPLPLMVMRGVAEAPIQMATMLLVLKDFALERDDKLLLQALPQPSLDRQGWCTTDAGRADREHIEHYFVDNITPSALCKAYWQADARGNYPKRRCKRCVKLREQQLIGVPRRLRDA